MLSRAVCSFRRITLPNGSRDAVKAALLQAERQAPAEINVSQIEQDPSNKKAAGLWTWAALESDAGPASGPAPVSSPRAIPETLARQPMAHGQRLVQCLEGVEGQVWMDNALMASRWWPAAPQQRQWVAFLRAARLDTSEGGVDIPPVVEVPWRTNLPVWEAAGDAARTLVTPGRLLIIGGTILAAMLVHNGAQYFRYTQTRNSLDQQIEDRKIVVNDVLAERNKAIQNLQTIDRLARMGQGSALLRGVAGILEKVQGEGMRMSRFTLSDGQLDVRLSGKAQTRGAALVSLLEEDEAVTQISVNFKANDVIEISGRLAANAELPGARTR